MNASTDNFQERAKTLVRDHFAKSEEEVRRAYQDAFSKDFALLPYMESAINCISDEKSVAHSKPFVEDKKNIHLRVLDKIRNAYLHPHPSPPPHGLDPETLLSQPLRTYAQPTGRHANIIRSNQEWLNMSSSGFKVSRATDKRPGFSRE